MWTLRPLTPRSVWFHPSEKVLWSILSRMFHLPYWGRRTILSPEVPLVPPRLSPASGQHKQPAEKSSKHQEVHRFHIIKKMSVRIFSPCPDNSLVCVSISPPQQDGHAEVSFVWSGEYMQSRILSGAYMIYRFFRYGRTIDLETVYVGPSHRVDMNGTLSHPDVPDWYDTTYGHFTGTYDAGSSDIRLYVNTWNHLMSPIPRPSVQYVELTGYLRTTETRDALERRLSIPFPWRPQTPPTYPTLTFPFDGSCNTTRFRARASVNTASIFHRCFQ